MEVSLERYRRAALRGGGGGGGAGVGPGGALGARGRNHHAVVDQDKRLQPRQVMYNFY